jgi:hypothetical protein
MDSVGQIPEGRRYPGGAIAIDSVTAHPEARSRSHGLPDGFGYTLKILLTFPIDSATPLRGDPVEAGQTGRFAPPVLGSLAVAQLQSVIETVVLNCFSIADVCFAVAAGA